VQIERVASEAIEMGAIMIKCPVTGRDVPTSLDVEPVKFSSMPVFFSRTYCTHCKTEHEWFAKEAWVCDAEAPEPPEGFDPHLEIPINIEESFHFQYVSQNCVDTDGMVTLVDISQARLFLPNGDQAQITSNGIRLPNGPRIIASNSTANGGYGFNL
jgi:hypothetical protein